MDGGAYTLVDFYAPATAHQQSICRRPGLAPGPHTVAISSTVRRNPSSVGGNTYLDAFDVTGTLTQAPVRHQQADTRITYSGPWYTNASTSLSGGSYAAGTSTGTVLVSFTGTAIDLIGTLSPYGGIAEVSIDGGAPVDADFWGGAATSHKRRVWGVSGLSDAPHTLAVTVTTRRNPASLGGMAYVDAFDVAGTLSQAPVRHQQTDPRIALSGPWTTTSSTSLSGGSYAGGTSGAVMVLRFDGTALDLIGTLSSFGGIATVSVDGGAPADIDFYGAVHEPQAACLGRLGPHRRSPHRPRHRHEPQERLLVGVQHLPRRLRRLRHADPRTLRADRPADHLRRSLDHHRQPVAVRWPLRGRHLTGHPDPRLRRQRHRPGRHQEPLRRHRHGLDRRRTPDRRRLLRRHHRPQEPHLVGERAFPRTPHPDAQCHHPPERPRPRAATPTWTRSTWRGCWWSRGGANALLRTEVGHRRRGVSPQRGTLAKD